MNANPELIAEAIQRKRDGYKYVLLPGGATGVECDAVLADAYLAGHRGDDGEPLTEEWLRSVGGEWNDQQAGFGFRDRSLELWIRPSGQCWMFESSTYGGRVCLRKKLTTRGAFRNLASALNIDLKNPAEQNEPREGREGK